MDFELVIDWTLRVAFWALIASAFFAGYRFLEKRDFILFFDFKPGEGDRVWATRLVELKLVYRRQGVESERSQLARHNRLAAEMSDMAAVQEGRNRSIELQGFLKEAVRSVRRDTWLAYMFYGIDPVKAAECAQFLPLPLRLIHFRAVRNERSGEETQVEQEVRYFLGDVPAETGRPRLS